ncbi:hypothetical protein [Yoonia vestfoldensis]|jgi:hypothetical protein|uniref:Uncharacterized protein n=1 Tax=Yoonia vestfoldensis TaxID=245188 RepID=A0A1Y0E9U6_9RHOB|nr:hypothetical protein [Yoonia vestfoldensis]ARU00189.1 hypothetical protein LOKVESSMR4R_00856 [Yoonia vestfoldensis]
MSIDQHCQLILRLEAALLEYVEKYGLTEQARTLLTAAPAYDVFKSATSRSTKPAEPNDLV